MLRIVSVFLIKMHKYFPASSLRIDINDKVDFAIIIIGFLLLVGIITFLLTNIISRKKIEQEIINLNLELSAAYGQLEAQYNEIHNHDVVLDKQKERYLLICEASAGGLWDLDLKTKERFFTVAWYTSYGFTKKDTEHIDNWIKHIHPDDLSTYLEYKKDIKFSNGEKYSCEYRINTVYGYRWFVEKCIIMRDEDGKIIRVAGSNTDITEKKLQDMRIEKLAFYDTLTELPNRTFLNNQFPEILKKCNENKLSGITIFIDIDKFKLINDFFGHDMGDKIIVYLSKKLSELYNDDEKVFISKYGGDEFIVIIEGIENDNQIRDYIQKTIGIFERKFVLDNNELYVTASMGVVVFPQNGDTVEVLLRNADTALNQAKESGRNCYRMFEEKMNLIVGAKMTLQNSLMNAAQNNEFVLYYQPQIDAISGDLSGFEALIRWASPKHGFVPPDQFIKLAEEIGAIVGIGKWVLREACKFCKKMNQNQENNYRIAVNISPIELMQYEFADNVKRIITEVGVNPELIELEITETALMGSFTIIVEKLIALKKFGVSISLDDFGTGYSSLNRLKQLPIDTVKIDKSFIDDLKPDNQELNFVDIIIAVAHRMKMKVVAEGVETDIQRDILISQQCDVFQGFFFSKPLPEKDAIDFINNY